MKKFLTISVALTMAFSSVAADDVSIIWSNNPGQFLASGISDDGKYVCGNNTIWNLNTGETVSTYDINVTLGSISNTGMAVGNATDYAVSVEANGDMRYIDGMDFVNFSTARAISADGSIIVGSRFDNLYRQEACYWENGVHHKLPVPEIFEDMPDDVEIYSIAAGGVNADGSVIIGNIITGTGAEAVVMWTRNDAGEYEFHPLYAGLMEFGWELEKPYIQMEAQSVSANGKWISIMLQPNSFDDMSFYAGRYNIETGEVEEALKMDAYVGDYYPTGITDDGMTIGFIEQEQMSMFGRQGFIWTPGSDKAQLLSECYNDTPELTEMETGVSLVLTSITSDGKYLTGFSIQDESNVNSFVMTLGSTPSGISHISTDTEKAKEIYNIQGVRVCGEPTPGIYIVTENGKSRKIMVK